MSGMLNVLNMTWNSPCKHFWLTEIENKRDDNPSGCTCSVHVKTANLAFGQPRALSSTSNLRNMNEIRRMLTENFSLKASLQAPWHCTDHIPLPECLMYLPLLLLEWLYISPDQDTCHCLVLTAEPAFLSRGGRDSYLIPVVKMNKCLSQPPRQVDNVQKNQVSSINQT